MDWNRTRRLLLASAAALIGALVLVAPVRANVDDEHEHAKVPERFQPPAPRIPLERALGDDRSFAVVELFTSESSQFCPRADTTLAALTSEAAGLDLPVIALAFHSDLFGKVSGWVDPFATVQYRDRHREYSDRFGMNGLVLPLAVVNGTARCNGMKDADLRKLVMAALAEPRGMTVEVKAHRNGPHDEVIVQYGLSEPRPGMRLNLALVESGRVREITSGPNAGWTIDHKHLVRTLDSLELKTEENGEHWLLGPTDLRYEGASVVAYLQDPATGRVLAAAQAPVSIETEP